ncbi:hypothetical protein CLV24_12089 [Pontibacter ummariensis]|uniref:Uncharacterized protein n=1 Tax=Pontibacter ummariensis TaxID=1610492 RepID=A0A239J7M4_9BACT|nr:hypothetical protein [Pontibacter ummariensis]PRY08921.1 hypothetical protein CLV24_12089 [Pontibacter ummariensis]SNT01867.1 hypothetical protein SAMN06296052_12088 [Pontibacter ummariensis]
MQSDNLVHPSGLSLRPFSFLLSSLLVLLLLSGCARREAFNEDSQEMMVEDGAEGEPEIMTYDGKLLAQVVEDSVIYIVSTQELIQPFIREFGDGTVVDKVMISKVQETEEDTAAYYLVGLGIRNGAFRSMAMELDVAARNALYLSSKAAKHMCLADIGCSFCYFTFIGNKITGCECGTRSPGTNCVHKVADSNTLLKGTRIGENHRQNSKRR